MKKILVLFAIGIASCHDHSMDINPSNKFHKGQVVYVQGTKCWIYNEPSLVDTDSVYTVRVVGCKGDFDDGCYMYIRESEIIK